MCIVYFVVWYLSLYSLNSLHLYIYLLYLVIWLASSCKYIY